MKLDNFDTIARHAIRADFASKDSSSALFLSHHSREFSAEERQVYFGANVPGLEHLLRSVRLRRVGLYPEGRDYVAVFDYALPEGATQYILAVELDRSGSVVSVSMDS